MVGGRKIVVDGGGYLYLEEIDRDEWDSNQISNMNHRYGDLKSSMHGVGLYGKIEYALEGGWITFYKIYRVFSESEFENKLTYWICARNDNNDKYNVIHDKIYHWIERFKC